MKKLLLVLMLVLSFALCGCSGGNTDNSEKIMLKYSYNNTKVTQKLTNDEANAVADIFAGKTERNDSPDCGFNENITIVFDNTAYVVANDEYAIIKNCSNDKCFNISDDERKQIDELFAKYG